MSYIDRNQIFASDSFQAQVKIALADWVNYWATNGTESIEDPDIREKTDIYIKFCISNIEYCSKSLATMVIGEPNIISADEITDSEIERAVTHVLATALMYLL